MRKHVNYFILSFILLITGCNYVSKSEYEAALQTIEILNKSLESSIKTQQVANEKLLENIYFYCEFELKKQGNYSKIFEDAKKVSSLTKSILKRLKNIGLSRITRKEDSVLLHFDLKKYVENMQNLHDSLPKKTNIDNFTSYSDNLIYTNKANILNVEYQILKIEYETLNLLNNSLGATQFPRFRPIVYIKEKSKVIELGDVYNAEIMATNCFTFLEPEILIDGKNYR